MIEYVTIGALLGGAWYYVAPPPATRRRRLGGLARFLLAVGLGAVMWLPLAIVAGLVIVGMAIVAVIDQVGGGQ